MKLCRRVFTSFVLVLVVCVPSACGLQKSKKEQRRTPTSKEVVKKSKEQPAPDAPRAPYAAGALVASLEDPAVDESSGLAASRREPGLFWTHNDAGDGPFIYAFDRQGRKRGTFRVAGAQADDWEDIDAGPGPKPGQSYLYVGDIGDNEFARPNIVVYRVAEPQVTPEDARSTRFEPRATEQAEAFALKYTDGQHNAEAMAVHPRTGDIYVITKEGEGPAKVYRAAAPAAGATEGTLERVGEVSAPAAFPGMITGADISPDGRRVVLCDYVGAYELSVEGNAPFDNVWKQTPRVFDPGKRRQGEAISYSTDGASVFSTSEGKNAQLFEARRQEGKQ
ncbi:MAG TPA: hypothetical protein VGV38_02495 [Pyrinomonadaceae bacterium]|nr:hypothetical protein [Pyrinomonadaceae bacterium]